MPYGPNEIPQWLKNLPKGAQALGRRVFNAVYAKTHDDNQARMAAWAQIKHKYRKSGDTWVKLKSAEGELLVSLAQSSEAPGVIFALDEVVVQTLLQESPLRWGAEQKYYQMTIGNELRMVFDENPLTTPDVSLVAYELPFQPFSKIVSQKPLDTGTVQLKNMLSFSGKLGTRLLTEEQLEQGSATMDVFVCMAATKDTIKFTRSGNLLYFEGLALAPGVWTGIDGHSMKYDTGVITEGSKSFPFRRMKSRHKDRDVDVVGFTTGVAMKEGQAWIQGYVFDQREIQEIEADIAAGKPIGISPELHSLTSMDSDGMTYVAHSIESRSFSFVDYPACKTSWVNKFSRVNPEQLNN